MKISPISVESMVEKARQNYNKRHPFAQLPAPNTESRQKLSKEVQRQTMWEDVIKRVTRKFKWQKLV